MCIFQAWTEIKLCHLSVTDYIGVKMQHFDVFCFIKQKT